MRLRRGASLVGIVSLLVVPGWSAGVAAAPAPDTVGPAVQVAPPRTPPVRQRFIDNLHGTVSDDQAGVDRIVVTYSPRTNLGDERWTATVYGCDDQRRSCSWEVGLPGTPGQYRITVVATDRAGNSSATVVDGALIA